MRSQSLVRREEIGDVTLEIATELLQRCQRHILLLILDPVQRGVGDPQRAGKLIL